MSVDLLELQDVSKSFWIPDERRDTIREHVFSAFRPRPLRELKVLESVSLTLQRGEARIPRVPRAPRTLAAQPHGARR